MIGEVDYTFSPTKRECEKEKKKKTQKRRLTESKATPQPMNMPT